MSPTPQTHVKNGFSDPNKEQEGHDHQGKALKEGCREREWAWTGVSQIEETSTK